MSDTRLDGVDFSKYKDQVKPWSDKWIARMTDCSPIEADEQAKIKEAIEGLYSTASLPRPLNTVFAKGLISGTIASAIASGVWYLRDKPDVYFKLFGEKFDENALQKAVPIACKYAVEFAQANTRGLSREVLDRDFGELVEKSISDTLETTLAAIAPEPAKDVFRRAFAEAASRILTSAVDDAVRTVQVVSVERAFGTASVQASDAKIDSVYDRFVSEEKQTTALAAEFSSISKSIREEVKAALADAADQLHMSDDLRSIAEAAKIVRAGAEENLTEVEAGRPGAFLLDAKKASKGMRNRISRFNDTSAAIINLCSSKLDDLTKREILSLRCTYDQLIGEIEENTIRRVDLRNFNRRWGWIELAVFEQIDSDIKYMPALDTKYVPDSSIETIKIANDVDTGTADEGRTGLPEVAYSVRRYDPDRLPRFLATCCQDLRSMREGALSSDAKPWVTFFRDVVTGLDVDYSYENFYEVASKAGPRYMHEKFCIVANRPETVRQDDLLRNHGENGPSHAWRDGFALYHWHGMRVPMQWIEDKKNLDPALAITWPNVEQRRAIAEIVGWVRILDQLEARVIDADADPEIGTLVEVDLPGVLMPARFLRVQCGTKREFALSVPRNMLSAAEANAWTFGLDKKSFKIEVRT